MVGILRQVRRARQPYGVRQRRGDAPRTRAFRASVEGLEGRALLSHAAAGLHPLQARRLAHAAQVQAQPAQKTVSAVRVIRDIPYRNDGVKLDLYIPVGHAPAGGWPAIVAFPGGGWKWASKTEYGSHVGALAQDGYVVAVADYTYSPGTPGSKVWPVNFEDVRGAVQWVRKHAGRYHINPNELVAMGVSSGAYMANMLGVYPDGPVSPSAVPADAKSPGAPDGVSARVQAVVDFYGPTDLTALYQAQTRAQSSVVTFLGGTPDQIPQVYQAASPVQFISSADPPFLIFQGTADQSVPPAQSTELADALTAAGVPHRLVLMNGISHGFELRLGPVDLTPDIVTFLHEALNHQPITGGPNP